MDAYSVASKCFSAKALTTNLMGQSTGVVINLRHLISQLVGHL